MSTSWESMVPAPADAKEVAAAEAKKVKSAMAARDAKHKKTRGVRKAVAESFLVPPDRFVMTPQWEIYDDFHEKLGSGENEAIFNRVNRLIEATAQFDFLAIRRQVKRNFQFFAVAGTGKRIPHRLDSPAETAEELDGRELDFVEDFYNLLLAAHFKVISRQEWETAQDENFTFNSPVDVNWNALDNTLLKRFWEKHPAEKRRAAPISDHVLLLHRGIYTVTARGTFIMDKVDLLVQYLVLDPLGWLWGKATGKKGKVDITLLLQQSVSGPGDEVLEEDEDEAATTRPGIAGMDKRYKASLKHANAKVVQRVSLQRLMPTVKSVLVNVMKEMEIQEPTYKDVVVLYRRTIPDKPVKKSDRDPVVNCNPDIARRNIRVMKFRDIPMADVEMVFPDKKIWLKPIMFIQLAVTLIGGLIAAFFTMGEGEALTLSLVTTALTLIYGRYAQVMSSAQQARQEVQDVIVSRMFEQTQDSQESDVNALLDEIAEQHVKEAQLAYYTLLALGRPVTRAELDEECEDYLDKTFGEMVDFAIENSLPGLLKDGLVVSSPEGMLTPVPLPEAYRILAGKWAGFFERDENAVSLPGVTLAAARARLSAGKAYSTFSDGLTSVNKGLGTVGQTLGSVGTSIAGLMPTFGFTSSNSGAAGSSTRIDEDAGMNGSRRSGGVPSTGGTAGSNANRSPSRGSAGSLTPSGSASGKQLALGQPRQRKRDMLKAFLRNRKKAA